MKIVIIGLSLSSSWGNGHATTYRALLKSLWRRGHDIVFLERDVPWYANHRDLSAPEYCRLKLYQDLADLHRYASLVASADVVVIGSFVPDGIDVINWALPLVQGNTAFYDIDTPATVAAIRSGSCSYLAKNQIPRFDLYLSFTGGPLLREIEQKLGAKSAHALYCSVDTEVFHPLAMTPRWDLGYLGTYSPDRQTALEHLLLEPARRQPSMKFVVAGAQYPSDTCWPDNVERITHIPPERIPEFFAGQRWTLNLTRAEMIAAGFSPSVRLFEAAACAVPIISDRWQGLDTLLSPGREILLAHFADDVLECLTLTETDRRAVANAARARILSAHTSDHRAAEFEQLIFAEQIKNEPPAQSDANSARRNPSAAIRL